MEFGGSDSKLVGMFLLSKTEAVCNPDFFTLLTPTRLSPAPPGYSFSEDRLVGHALHRLPGAPQGTSQLHQNSGERHDPRRDDPQGEGGGVGFPVVSTQLYGCGKYELFTK